jgi:hypothetical protein
LLLLLLLRANFLILSLILSLISRVVAKELINPEKRRRVLSIEKEEEEEEEEDKRRERIRFDYKDDDDPKPKVFHLRRDLAPVQNDRGEEEAKTSDVF